MLSNDQCSKGMHSGSPPPGRNGGPIPSSPGPRRGPALTRGLPPAKHNEGNRAGMVRILSYVDAEMSAEPMPFDCEHIVDSGLGWLISMEK